MKTALILTLIILGGLLIALPVAQDFAMPNAPSSRHEDDRALVCQISGIVMSCAGIVVALLGLVLQRFSSRP